MEDGSQLLVRFFSLSSTLQDKAVFYILGKPAGIYNCKNNAYPNKNPDLTVVYIVAVERVNRAYLFDYFQLRIDVNLVH